MAGRTNQRKRSPENDSPQFGGAIRLTWTKEGRLLDEESGVVIDAGSSPDVLGATLWHLYEEAQEVERMRQVVMGWVTDLMDSNANWTLHAGPFTLTADSPESHQEWDTTQLDETLTVLEAEGAISEDTVRACWRTKYVREPAAKQLNALLKVGGKVSSLVVACRQPKATQRRVKVEVTQ